MKKLILTLCLSLPFSYSYAFQNVKIVNEKQEEKIVNSKVVNNESLISDFQKKSTWNNDWISCSNNEQCVSIFFDCNGQLSINKKHMENVQLNLYKFRNDPRAISCPQSFSNKKTLNQCISQKCTNVETN